MGEKRDEARIKILQQFFYLAKKQGLNKTTIRQLGSNCGMSPGHIRFYFPKKEELTWSIYLNFCHKINIIISKINLPNNPLLEFFFSQLLKFYFTYERRDIFRVYAESSEDSAYKKKRIEKSFEETKVIFQKIGLHADDDAILIGSVCAIQSLYGLANILHIYDSSLDYKQVLDIFINLLFIQIPFPEKESYIEKTLQLFEQQDKKHLLEALQNLDNYYFWETEKE